MCNYLGILKLHINTYSDFSLEKIEMLTKISKDKQFLIWMNWKFAVMGNIMYNQLTGVNTCIQMVIYNKPCK